MLTYEIRLPKGKSASSFEKFMRDEYVPAVRKGPTRVGQVTELVLLRREPTPTSHRFLWLVGWSGIDASMPAGPAVDDEAVVRKFEKFGPKMKRLEKWEEVASWHS